MLVLLYASLPYLLSIVLAFGVAVAALLQYRLAARVSPETRLAVAVLVIGFGALLSVALTSRTLDEDRIAAEEILATYGDYAGGFAASRWISLLLIAASLVEVVRGWVEARGRRRADPATPVCVALLAFYLGTLLIQATVSDHPGFSFRDLYVPIVLLAVYQQRPQSLGAVSSACKWALLAIASGSLLAMLLRPEFAVHRPDPSWLPGIDWRLYGLTPHANTLGPLGLLAIGLELHSPSRSRTLRWTHLGAGAAILLLAQSKTAWAAALVIGLVIHLPLAWQRGQRRAVPAERYARSLWAVCVLAVILAAAVAGFFGFDALGAIERHDDLATLTGRTRIWEITLQAWHDNLFFGYGPEIWGPERQMRFRMFHVGHAHNQVVQTLGEAGLAGLVLLLFYIGTLFRVALRCFTASRGAVLMLLVIVLVRCVTEAPLRVEGLLSWATFLQVTLLAVACHSLRENPPEPAAVASAPGPGQGGDRRPDEVVVGRRRSDEVAG